MVSVQLHTPTTTKIAIVFHSNYTEKLTKKDWKMVEKGKVEADDCLKPDTLARIPSVKYVRTKKPKPEKEQKDKDDGF